MSDRVTLITLQEFRELARPTSAHLEESEVLAYVRECEDKYIIPAIGWNYFRAATGKTDWGEVADATFVPSVFLDGGEWSDGKAARYCFGLKKALAYFAYARLIRSDGAMLSRSGIMRHNDQYATRGDDTQKSVYNDAVDMAEAYLSEAMTYLKAHQPKAAKPLNKMRGSRIHIHAIGN